MPAAPPQTPTSMPDSQRLFPGSLEARVCSSVSKTVLSIKAFISFLLSLRWVAWLLF